MWTWSAIARGAKGINFYAWYPMSSGYESGGRDVLVFVFNHGQDPAMGIVSLRMPPGEHIGTNLETERPVALSRNKDSVRFSVTLGPSAVQVLRIGEP